MAVCAGIMAGLNVASAVFDGAKTVVGWFKRKKDAKQSKAIVHEDAVADGQKVASLKSGSKVWLRSGDPKKAGIYTLKRRKTSMGFKLIKRKKLNKKGALIAVTAGDSADTMWVSRRVSKRKQSHSKIKSPPNLSKRQFATLARTMTQEFKESRIMPPIEEHTTTVSPPPKASEPSSEDLVKPARKNYDSFDPVEASEEISALSIPSILQSDKAFDEEERLKVLAALLKMDQNDPVVQKLMALGGLWDAHKKKKHEVDQLHKQKHSEQMKSLEAKHAKEMAEYKAFIMARINELEAKKQGEIKALDQEKEVLSNTPSIDGNVVGDTGERNPKKN